MHEPLVSDAPAHQRCRSKAPNARKILDSSLVIPSHEKLSNFYKILNLSSLDQKQHQIEGVQWLLNKEITHSTCDNPILKGGILADDPQILAGSIAGKANINNFYLSFSREQEREALARGRGPRVR